MIAAHAALTITHGVAGGVADTLILNAHTDAISEHNLRNIYQLQRTGEYFPPFPVEGTGTASALTAGRLYAFPFPISRDVTIDRLAIQVTTADAGKKVRLGIYQHGANVYPGALLLDAGEVDVGANGVKEIVISQALPRSMYFLAIISDGVPELRRLHHHLALMGIDDTDFGKPYIYWYKAQAYGALPGSFPAAGSRMRVAGPVYQQSFARLLSWD